MKRTLEQWLRWQETLHPATVELGLARVRRVLDAMGQEPPGWPVITVAGTNGKGSSIAMLESIYRAAGYRTAAYTSPHLWRYNERLRLSGEAVADRDLCSAFERVEWARGDVALTYFEFGTLAALELIARWRPDVALLEVGLGGRLDAVNVVDPDVALITRIGLDHQDWLGSDRESIGFEKAGILRAGRPAVAGDRDLPASVERRATELTVPLYRLGRDFSAGDSPSGWCFKVPAGEALELPAPGLFGAHQRDNAAAVVMVTRLMADRLPVDGTVLGSGLENTRVPGRMQTLPGSAQRAVPVILDVAHNPDGSAALAMALAEGTGHGRTHAVVGVLADKALDDMLRPLLPLISQWHCADLPTTPRARSAQSIADALRNAGVASPPLCHADPRAALTAALDHSRPGDRVVVFGSFFTVAEATPDPENSREA